ncbi:MAG: S1C family serine protease [Archangium sp.]
MLIAMVALVLCSDGQVKAKAAPPGAATAFKVASPSVVVVMAATASGAVQGSGVAIAPGLVVTNKHVVDGAIGDIIVTQATRQWTASVVARAKTDLALLELYSRASECSAPPIVKFRPEPLEVGEAVFAIGSPKGLERTLSDGIVSGLPAPGVIQTTASISPGSSGGGLFDDRGRFIGVTTLTIRDAQQLNFVLSAELVRRLAERDDGVLEAAPSTPVEPEFEPEPYPTAPSRAVILPAKLSNVPCFVVSVEMDKSATKVMDARSVETWLLSTLRSSGIQTTSDRRKLRDCPAILSLSVDSLLDKEGVVLTYATTIAVLQNTTFADDDIVTVQTWSSSSFGYAGSNVVFDALKRAIEKLVINFREARLNGK